MSGKIPSGKSIFVWTLERVIDRWGSLEVFVTNLVLANTDAVLLKLVEGRLLFNQAHAEKFIQLCREAGIEVHGWSYNYGETNTWRENNDQTDIEAKLSAEMVVKYGLKSWIMNCEKEWKSSDGAPTQWADEALEVVGWYNYFWSELGIDVPIGFTSFKFPSAHNLPWEEFLSNVDYWVPQVYWQGDSTPLGPRVQLERSVSEHRARGGNMPIIGAGTIYKESNYPVTGQTWWPSPLQVAEFGEACKDLGLDGVCFWEAVEPIPARPDLWEAFSLIEWATTDPNPEPLPEPDLLDMVMENSVRLTVIESGIVALAKYIQEANLYPIPEPPVPPPPPTNGNGSGEPVPPLEPPPLDDGTVTLKTWARTESVYLSWNKDGAMNKGGKSGEPKMIMELYPSDVLPVKQRIVWRSDKPIIVKKGAIKTDGGNIYYEVVFDQQHRIPLYKPQWPADNGVPVKLYIHNKYIA